MVKILDDGWMVRWREGIYQWEKEEKEKQERIHTFVNDYFYSWLVKYEHRNHSLGMEIWESDLTENINQSGYGNLRIRLDREHKIHKRRGV